MENRFSGKKEKKRPDAGVVSSARKSSCHDAGEKNVNDQWPQGLLSIGTLGNDGPPPASGGPAAEGPRASQDLPDFTIEEVKKLQDALTKLLRRAKSKSSSRGSSAGDEERANLPLDRFLNCPSSLEVDRRVAVQAEANGGSNDGDLSPNTKMILSKARELLINSSSSTMRHKSFKFLLKKLVICGAGFSPTPSLKDPVESKMEKFFRAILHKKMNARQSNAAASRKYFLEDKPTAKTRGDHLHHHQEEEEKGVDIFKWDKTDSDFIVLEM